MSKEKVDISPQPKDPESVRPFYDQFVDSRASRYRDEKNPRIEKALARILPYVTRETTVFEIGCGVGVVTERIARKAKRGSIWACDISEKAIEYTRERIKTANVQLRCGDVLRRFDELKSWISKPVQLVVMVDVIEHLPLAEHVRLFHNLRSIMAKQATLILTFPSPQYQRYLQKKNPDELQIIDEVVELSHLMKLASETGFGISHFSLEDVWLKNQYVHCVLETSTEVRPYAERKSWKRRLPAPVRSIGRYGKQVFGRIRATRDSIPL